MGSLFQFNDAMEFGADPVNFALPLKSSLRKRGQSGWVSGDWARPVDITTKVKTIAQMRQNHIVCDRSQVGDVAMAMELILFGCCGVMKRARGAIIDRGGSETGLGEES
ncbi:hypothetical protein RESH_04284 [Rhodopirellula europaea SH398]|uniref:Uncharacterized protein n=1 Tax=Rhodopirellula europaea SH398 TaxID=1263868 RepID=M5S0R3_9BACT|nr:hypothetical protein RESH_04284 [Rhodopirellula europaea SH398]